MEFGIGNCLRVCVVTYSSVSTLISFCILDCYHVSAILPHPNINSFLVSGDFCHLLITFANSVDPDQDQQKIVDIYSFAKNRKLVASFPYTTVPGANTKAILVNQPGKKW